MIRVAWRVPYSLHWIAGLHYFKNLLEAVLMLSDRQIEPVLLSSGDEASRALGYSNLLPDLDLGSAYSPKRIAYRLERLILRNGGELARYLRKHGVDVLSHAEFLGSRSPIPALGWVPDFQHRHLPALFEKKEIAFRDSMHAVMAREMQGILFSSENSLQDFVRFYPRHRCRTHVLQFVAAPISNGLPAAEVVRDKYAIHEPYFHLPNQLWVHKNHGVVLEALRILDQGGSCPLVISTGQTHDRRRPEFFQQFDARVKKAGLQDRFRFLGLIDYSHVALLMRESVSVVNPSLFEGWSTTVEEAKSLGKRLLLSDIPVHREQAPERGMYFPPHDAEVLAQLMAKALNDFDLDTEKCASRNALELLPKRQAAFGRKYERIIQSVI